MHVCCCLPATNRPILYEMNQALFNEGRGNEEFANLPRKINVCISPSRDDFPHTQVRAGAANSKYTSQQQAKAPLTHRGVTSVLPGNC